MKKVLVTGGAGFVGTNLIKRLRNKGLKYREIKEELDKKGIKTITGKIYSIPNIQRVHTLITKSKKQGQGIFYQVTP